MHSLSQVLQTRGLVVARPGESVLRLSRRMSDGNVGAAVVLDEGRLVGIFSERDLMTRVVVVGRDAATTPVSAVMTREVVTADIADPTREAEAKMRRYGCRHLPVCRGADVVGMLSMRDLLRDELKEQGEEIRELRAYLHQAPLV
jgi:CBS domain-containing protein